jgi:anti-anti-sigma factor
MTVSSSAHGAVSVLSVSGTVDLATTAELASAIEAAAGAEPPALILDLTAVEFLASAGMALLVATHKRLAATGFAVVADGPATSRPLSLTGLDEVFDLHRTLPEALAALS